LGHKTRRQTFMKGSGAEGNQIGVLIVEKKTKTRQVRGGAAGAKKTVAKKRVKTSGVYTKGFSWCGGGIVN